MIRGTKVVTAILTFENTCIRIHFIIQTVHNVFLICLRVCQKDIIWGSVIHVWQVLSYVNLWIKCYWHQIHPSEHYWVQISTWRRFLARRVFPVYTRTRRSLKSCTTEGAMSGQVVSTLRGSLAGEWPTLIPGHSPPTWSCHPPPVVSICSRCNTCGMSGNTLVHHVCRYTLSTAEWKKSCVQISRMLHGNYPQQKDASSFTNQIQCNFQIF